MGSWDYVWNNILRKEKYLWHKFFCHVIFVHFSGQKQQKRPINTILVIELHNKPHCTLEKSLINLFSQCLFSMVVEFLEAEVYSEQNAVL